MALAQLVVKVKVVKIIASILIIVGIWFPAFMIQYCASWVGLPSIFTGLFVLLSGIVLFINSTDV